MEPLTLVCIGVILILLGVIVLLVVWLIWKFAKGCPSSGCVTCPTCISSDISVSPLFYPYLYYQSFTNSSGSCLPLNTSRTNGNTITLDGTQMYNCEVSNTSSFNVKFFYMQLYSTSDCSGNTLIDSSTNTTIIPPATNTTYIYTAIDQVLFEITYWSSSNTWVSMPIYVNGSSTSVKNTSITNPQTTPLITITGTSTTNIQAAITYS